MSTTSDADTASNGTSNEREYAEYAESTDTNTSTPSSPRRPSPPPPPFSRSPTPTSTSAPDNSEPVRYYCGSCDARILRRRKEAVRCEACRNRVLYKERSTDVVVFEAR